MKGIDQNREVAVLREKGRLLYGEGNGSKGNMRENGREEADFFSPSLI